MLYRNLIWDMDGTLFDTYRVTNRAIQAAFAEFGADVPLSTIDQLMNITYAHCLETLTTQYQLDPVAVDARRAEIYSLTTLDSQPLFPGVRDILRRIVAAGGRNYIYTHRERQSLDAFLALYQVTDLFTDTLTHDDGFPRKPDPAGFLALIKTHQLALAETLAIGDRALDIEAGQAAGIKTCYYGPEPPADATPDYAIASYDELPAILGLD